MKEFVRKVIKWSGFKSKEQVFSVVALGLAEAAVYGLSTPLMINTLGITVYTVMTWCTGKPYKLGSTYIAMRALTTRTDLGKVSPANSAMLSAVADVTFTVMQVATALVIFRIFKAFPISWQWSWPRL